MRAAIYNPYLDTLGGGERYTMAIASALAKNNYKVDIEWSDPHIKSKLEKRFGIKLDNVQIVENINRGDMYDLCFWVSDGSIPALKSRMNFLHFQVPFTKVGGKTLINKMKLFRIKKIICNSEFTKHFIDKEYGVDSVVLYPPVDTKGIKSGFKDNLILNVARFSTLKQSKRQDVLIDAFKKLYDYGNRKWKLVLAGGAEVGADEYLIRLKDLAKGYPVSIIESPSYRELLGLYSKAKFFWSASGYEIDEEKEPDKVEHFGITVVEAMAAGAIPVVYNAGGHREIVEHGKNGILWQTTKGLIDVTEKLIEEEQIQKMLIKNAAISATKYSYDRFEKEFLSFI